MAIRTIIEAPDPRLLLKSEWVGRFDGELAQLARDLGDTLEDAAGAGLAAIQIGVAMRVLAVDAEVAGQPHTLIVVNPEILESSDATDASDEGCLSMPDVWELVERPATVIVRFRTVSGEAVELRAEGQFARCLQHEIDHLDGIMYPQRVSRVRRERLLRRYAKLRKRAA